jgi:hypothetical protein
VGSWQGPLSILVFSTLLFCTPFGLDRDLSTLSFHVLEWPSCLQPAYKISPLPFPNYQHLSRHNFVTEDGAAHSSDMVVSPYNPKWCQNPKTIRWSSVPSLNLLVFVRFIYIILRWSSIIIVKLSYIFLCMFLFFKLLTGWWCFRHHPWHTALSL